jgi:hypothetical protein
MTIWHYERRFKSTDSVRSVCQVSIQEGDFLFSILIRISYSTVRLLDSF